MLTPASPALKIMVGFHVREAGEEMFSGIRGRRGGRRGNRTRKGSCLVERLELRRLLSAPVVNWIQGAGYSAGGFTPTDLAVGKFNADNFPDLVVGGNNQARILAGDGRGGFTLASTINTGFVVGRVAVGDLNNDGISDIVLNKTGAADYRVYLGNGNGTVRQPPGGDPLPYTDPIADIALADIDGDGKTDLIFAGTT